METLAHRLNDTFDGELAELPRLAQQDALQPSAASLVPQPEAAPESTGLVFWESEDTRPPFMLGASGNSGLVEAAQNYLDVCMNHPYLPVSQIRDQQLARMQQLVELAYRDIPVYRAKYQAAGFSPADLRC